MNNSTETEYQKMTKPETEFLRLLKIMDDLREKCPWDKKQTFESLRYLTIEEVYELSEAILEKNYDSIKSELGDLLLHIVFYSKLGSELNAFDITDVLHQICEKLIRRHPHIYGDIKVDNEEDVKKNWEFIKQKEEKKRILSGVSKGLPALVKAIRIQEKARGVGFDFENTEQTWQKVLEEFKEFQNASPNERSQELGDLLFAIINYSRFIGINAEDALENANQKFIRRFNFVEEQVEISQKQWSDFTLQELDEFWNQAKSKGL
jgi:XTP/dITP diphosphohydrolase